jgi:hypothetical protein
MNYKESSRLVRMGTEKALLFMAFWENWIIGALYCYNLNLPSRRVGFYKINSGYSFS